MDRQLCVLVADDAVEDALKQVAQVIEAEVYHEGELKKDNFLLIVQILPLPHT